MYTGGTTGRPKGVMLSHASLVVNALSANQAAPRPVDSVGINCAPMFHVGGMALVLQLAQRLARQVVLPGFDELPVLQTIAEERGTETFLVPTMLKRLVEHPRFADFDTSSLQCVLYGAAPIDDALLAAARSRVAGRGLLPAVRHDRAGAGGQRPAGLVPCTGAATGSATSTAALGGPRRAHRRGAHRRRRRPAGAARHGGRDRGARPAGDAGLLGQAGPDAPRPCAAAGCTPATVAAWTPTASSTWSTASRT